MKTKNYKKDEIKAALELYKEEVSIRDIANTLGCGISTIQRWAKKAGLGPRQVQNKSTKVEREPTKEQDAPINKLLLNMACGNDLSKWVGRSITSLQPREIYEFLRAINLEGELKVTQTVRI